MKIINKNLFYKLPVILMPKDFKGKSYGQKVFVLIFLGAAVR
jgi:hypothetical protein